MVRPKKHLGQHFLRDENIARKIVESLMAKTAANVIEVGPGTGVLTKYLIERKELNTHIIDIDTESIEYLKQKYASLQEHITEGDFLKINLHSIFNEPFNLIGNFPYNISSQIFFKLLEYRNTIPECVGMIQKEVAVRIASPPGNKDYGILSVLLQAFYDIDYLFTVSEHVFNPPPKVKSAVIRLSRNTIEKLPCNENKFFTIVKTSFNQRRKTLRNSLKQFLVNLDTNNELFSKRPEQLGVEEFVELTNRIDSGNH